MGDSKELSINWGRSIIIDSPIDDDLVKKLTPQILLLRQESTSPITIGIDSPGGSLASLEVLLGLLTGPDQDGNTGDIITVATHRAYSAAANFLAFGDYAVALRHSQVLYHDVRYGGIVDVTPEKARDVAKSLQDANDTFALRLAHRVIPRLIWIYIDLKKEFKGVQEKYSDLHKAYVSLISPYAPIEDGSENFDLASFAICLWSKLSSSNDSLIKNVMDRLARWINLTNIAKSAPTYKPKGSRTAGLLDGLNHLHKLFNGSTAQFKATEEHLKLFLSLFIEELVNKNSDRVDFSITLEQAVREFGILDSMNSPKHIKNASNLLLRHGYAFFDIGTAQDFDSKTEEERAALLTKAAPYASLLWHFCVLLCRELFEGEHILKPIDAQLLGLVDEVAGGGPVQSKRDFRIAREKKAASSTEND